jgi:hypothetical protein
MYTAITWMMGWVASRRKGRTRATPRTLAKVLSESNSVCSFSLPVSFRKRCAFLFRSVDPDVSGRKKIPESWMRAAAMLVDQKTHRQVVVSAMNAPAIGPTDGPSSGARL